MTAAATFVRLRNTVRQRVVPCAGHARETHHLTPGALDCQHALVYQDTQELMGMSALLALLVLPNLQMVPDPVKFAKQESTQNWQRLRRAQNAQTVQLARWEAPAGMSAPVQLDLHGT